MNNFNMFLVCKRKGKAIDCVIQLQLFYIAHSKFPINRNDQVPLLIDGHLA